MSTVAQCQSMKFRCSFPSWEEVLLFRFECESWLSNLVTSCKGLDGFVESEITWIVRDLGHGIRAVDFRNDAYPTTISHFGFNFEGLRVLEGLRKWDRFWWLVCAADGGMFSSEWEFKRSVLQKVLRWTRTASCHMHDIDAITFQISGSTTVDHHRT